MSDRVIDGSKTKVRFALGYEPPTSGQLQKGTLYPSLYHFNRFWVGYRSPTVSQFDFFFRIDIHSAGHDLPMIEEARGSQMGDRFVSAVSMARKQGKQPKAFRQALREEQLEWHILGSRWLVREGSPEYTDMMRVLAKLEAGAHRPRGRKGPTSKTPMVTLRIPVTLSANIDAWVAAQGDPRPSRSEAIRRLLAAALKD